MIDVTTTAKLPTRVVETLLSVLSWRSLSFLQLSSFTWFYLRMMIGITQATNFFLPVNTIGLLRSTLPIETMLPSPAFPEDLLPETLVFTAFKTGHHFDSYEWVETDMVLLSVLTYPSLFCSAFFEHLVGRKFPPPSAKPKEKGAAGASIVWHERNLPKSSLTSSDTSLDFHVQLAILYLVPLTPSRSLDQLVDTLNEYLRRRFVKGERILLKRQNKWLVWCFYLIINTWILL